MTLIEMKVREFVDVLGSDAPAPGGGSAAGLAGSIGISLTKMVAELTVGKKKYQDHESLARSVKVQAQTLQAQLLQAIDEDTAAFNQVSAVFPLPKNTEEEKKARKKAMQDALQGASQAPFHIMELSLESLKLTQSLMGKSNTSATSDLGVAALNLKAALQGAWLNVLINLTSIEDEAFVTKYQENGQALLDEGCQLADQIYQEILAIV